MKASGTLAILLGAIMVLGAPATAAAKPGYTIKPKSLHLKLSLAASNGYSASIKTNGHRQVVLSVTKGGFTAAHTALGRVTRKGIKADFGSFGRVSLRFRSKRSYHPTDLLSFLYKRCRGRKLVGERGTFAGNVRFEGERGYARVRAHRATGTVVRSYRRICENRFRAGASAAKPGEEDVLIIAQAKSGGVLRSMFGFRSPILGFTIAFGGEKRKLGRVAVQKTFAVIDYPRAIRISPRGKNPVTAKVKLARPFEGFASYSKEGKASPVWSGNLRVRMPGSGLVPLTGPEFETEICRSLTVEELLRCIDRLSENLPAYGSGSHSQPLALARLSSLR